MVMALLDPTIAQGEIAAQVRQSIVDEVIDAVNREFPGTLLRSPEEAERRQVEERVRALVSAAFRARGLPPSSVNETALTDEVARRVMGLGFLDLLLPPARTDLIEIAINSSGLVQVMKKGKVHFENAGMEVEAAEVWRVLNLILGPQSRAANEATPSVYARLPATRHNPGGGRVNVLHPVIAPGKGYPAVNIRLFEQKPVHPEWLLERGLMLPEMMEFLGRSMREGKRILICGATCTGKTTLLSALCNFLPEPWRIIKIEDPEEIWIDRPTVQTIEARHVASNAQIPDYTLADGVRDAMRMSPNYLILGEVRDGFAAMALLRAQMTGHAGASTIHADSPRDALDSLSILLGMDKAVRPREAARLTAASVDLLVQLDVVDEVRRAITIARIEKHMRGEEVDYQLLWKFDESSIPDRPRWSQVEETEIKA